MKTAACWIFLMFLLALGQIIRCAKPAPHSNRLLEQIYSTATDLQRHEKLMNNTFVDVVFDRKKCKCEDFCFAQEILSKALYEKNHNKLTRALVVYTNMKKCQYTSSGVKYPLMYLTRDIIHCVQQHLSHPDIQC